MEYSRRDRKYFLLFPLMGWGVALILTIIYAIVAGILFDEDIKGNIFLALSLSSLAVFVFPLLFAPFGRKMIWRTFNPKAWHWTKLRPLGLNAWVALAGYIALTLGIIALVATLSEWIVGMLPESWGIDTTDAVEAELRPLLTEGWGNRIWQFVAIALVPAISEELFFRGYLQRILKLWLSPTRALWLTSIIFALVHVSAVGFLPRVIMGLALGYLSERTNHLMPSIILHAANNALALALMIWMP